VVEEEASSSQIGVDEDEERSYAAAVVSLARLLLL
jgi:hypothetical protein